MSLETIYEDLPALTDFSDEVLNLKLIVTNHPKIQIFNSRSYLKDFARKRKTSVQICDETIDEATQHVYQKKIIPKSETFLNVESESISSKSELIVVASLIDRIPNLGGLSRTCEIFGVKEYVINNLSIIETKEFQNLSVSADKWLNISKVTVEDLPKYLLDMKNLGYVITACEQSTQSQYLQKHQFPKKTLMLLG